MSLETKHSSSWQGTGLKIREAARSRNGWRQPNRTPQLILDHSSATGSTPQRLRLARQPTAFASLTDRPKTLDAIHPANLTPSFRTTFATGNDSFQGSWVVSLAASQIQNSRPLDIGRRFLDGIGGQRLLPGVPDRTIRESVFSVGPMTGRGTP